MVSAVGYKTKKVIIKNKLKINLEKVVFELKETILTIKKTKYNFLNKSGHKRKGRHFSSHLIGTNVVTYIKNNHNIKGKLKTINLYLSRTYKKTSWKAPVFLAKFNIKIYEYDSINKRPGKELLHKNLIISPKNKKYILKVNVKKLDIIVPKNVICVGVEFVDKGNEFKKYNHVGPSLRFTEGINKKITWTNYRNRSWRNGSNSFFYKKQIITNLMLDVDILYPKTNL